MNILTYGEHKTVLLLPLLVFYFILIIIVIMITVFYDSCLSEEQPASGDWMKITRCVRLAWAPQKAWEPKEPKKVQGLGFGFIYLNRNDTPSMFGFIWCPRSL